MEERLQALEGKVSEYGHFRLDLGALISELASLNSNVRALRLDLGAHISELAPLNSNVRALTEAMVSSLKHSQDKLQHVSKVDADETPAANTSIGKTTHRPPPSLSEPEGAERTRYYTRVYSGSRGKEVVRGPSPPPSENV